MVSFNTKHFSEEINHNFNIMQRSLDEGKFVDLGFLPIFTRDLESLSKGKIDNKIVVRLQGRLETLAERTVELAKGPLSTDLQQEMDKIADSSFPLKSLRELSEKYKEGAVKRGLEILDPSFKYLPIKGDGHCLYRSIMAGVLASMTTTEAVRDKLFRHWQEVLKSLGNPAELVAGFQKLVETASSISDLKKFRDAVDRDDESVKFMRQLACEWNRKFGNESFQNEAIVFSGSVAQYLKDQADMGKALMGGNPELVALSNALGVNIQVMHADAIGRGEDPNAKHNIFLGPEAESDVQILYRPGHYDLLLSK